MTDENEIMRGNSMSEDEMLKHGRKEAFKKAREWSETHTRDQLREKLDEEIAALQEAGSSPPSHICEVCGEGFDTSYTLEGHRQKHEAEEHDPVSCSICGDEFDNEWGLIGHQQLHLNGDDAVECGICGEEFRNSKIFEDHKRNHVLESQSSDRSDACSQDVLEDVIHELMIKSYRPIAKISDDYDVPIDIVRMLDRHDLDKMEYKCMICLDVFCSKSSVGTHLSSTHGESGDRVADRLAVEVRDRSQETKSGGEQLATVTQRNTETEGGSDR